MYDVAAWAQLHRRGGCQPAAALRRGLSREETARLLEEESDSDSTSEFADSDIDIQISSSENSDDDSEGSQKTVD